MVDANGEHMDNCGGGSSAHKGRQKWAGRVGGGQEAGRRQAGGGQQVGRRWAEGGQQAGRRWAASRWGGRQKAGRRQAGGRKWTGSRQGGRQEVGRKQVGQEGLVFYKDEKDLREELMLVLGIHSFKPNHSGSGT